MPVLTGTATPYRVPRSTAAPLVYRGLPLDQVEDVVLTSSTWRQVAPFLLPKEEVQGGRPITPLHAGHVGLLCTAGLLNGVFGQGSDRHIDRWRTVKSVTVFEVKEQGFKEIHKRERFNNELALIYEDGRTLVLGEEKKKEDCDAECASAPGAPQYTRNTEKTNTQISVHVDRYIGNREQAHLLSVFGGDAEVGAIRAAIYERHTFTLTFPSGATRTHRPRPGCSLLQRLALVAWRQADAAAPGRRVCLALCERNCGADLHHEFGADDEGPHLGDCGQSAWTACRPALGECCLGGVAEGQADTTAGRHRLQPCGGHRNAGRFHEADGAGAFDEPVAFSREKWSSRLVTVHHPRRSGAPRKAGRVQRVSFWLARLSRTIQNVCVSFKRANTSTKAPYR